MRSARLAALCLTLLSTAPSAAAQTQQFTTRTLSIVNLSNPTEEVRVSPNLLTKLYFPDDVIEEIKSGNPNLFTIEINEAGNEISLRAAAKAGFTDLYVKTASGREAAFLLKAVTDAQGGPRQFIINSPVMTAAAPSSEPTTPGSIPVLPGTRSSAPTTPAPLSALRAPAQAATQTQTTQAPTQAKAPTQVQAPRPAAPPVTRLTNPVTVAASSSEPVDYRTQAVIDKQGGLTMYYEMRNISGKDLNVDPQNLTVTADGRRVDFQLLRKPGTAATTLLPNSNEIGAIMLTSSTNYKTVEVSWTVTDNGTSYTYSRSFNVKDMAQP